MTYTTDRFVHFFSGNSKLIHNLARVFHKEVPGQLEALRQARLQQSSNQTEQAAHRLKGAVSNYAYPELVDLLDTIERRATTGEALGLRDLTRVEQMVQNMLEALQQFLLES